MINVKIGYLAEFFYFDDQGYSAWSSASNDQIDDNVPQSAIDNYHACLMQRYIDTKSTKFEQQNSIFPSTISNYVVVPTQVQGDSVLRHARFSSEDMVTEVLKSAAKVGMLAAVKTHPRCGNSRFKEHVASMTEKYGALSVDKFNIHDVLNAASYVATVNSGSGFEALLHLKTVLSFGASDYQAATCPIADLSLIDKLLGGAISHVPDRKIKAFLYGYLRRRQISILDPEFDDKVLAFIVRKAATGAVGYLAD